MSRSEFETKTMPMIGAACLIVAIIAFALYLISPDIAEISILVSGVFLAIGIAFLGAWIWMRSAKKIGSTIKG